MSLHVKNAMQERDTSHVRVVLIKVPLDVR